VDKKQPFVPKNTVITAPAGSGKPHALSEKFIRLLKDDFLNMSLNEIVAITFTNKAAGELKRRVLSKLMEEAPEILRSRYYESTSRFRISTIHSFFRSLVEAVDPYSPLKLSDFGSNQMPDWLKAEIMKAALKSEEISNYLKFFKPDRTAAYIEEMFYSMPVSYVWAKSMVENAEKRKDSLVVQWLAELSRLFLELNEKYQEWKIANNLLEFSDIELFVYRLIEEEQNLPVSRVLLSFNEQIRALLIDEFQDTSKIQWRIIEKLAEEWLSGQGLREANQGSIYLIGDPKQSIYLFRGTDVSIMVDITREFSERAQSDIGSEVYAVESLKDNYRSLPVIIDFVNRTFEKLFSSPADAREDHITVYERFNATRTDEHKLGRVVAVFTDGESLGEISALEADFISNEILNLVRSGRKIYDPRTGDVRLISFGDIAILLKTRTGLEALEKKLFEKGIPFISVDSGYTSLKPLNFLLTFLKLFDPRHNRDNLVPKILKLLNMDSYIGEYRNLKDIKEKAPQPLNLLSAAYEKFVDAYVKEGLFGAFIASKSILEDLMHRSQLEPEQIEYSLRILSEVIYYMETNGIRNLKSIADVVKGRISEIIPELSVFPNAVTVMSIHKSKGLEFPVVFVANLYRQGKGKSFQFLPSAAENNFKKQLDSVYFSVNPNRHFSLMNTDNPLFEDFKKAVKSESDRLKTISKSYEAEDEKRLLYVAVTRARDILYVLLPKEPKKIRNISEVILSFADILKGDKQLEKIDYQIEEQEKDTQQNILDALLHIATFAKKKIKPEEYDVRSLLNAVSYEKDEARRLKKGKPASEEIEPERKFHEKIAAGSLIHQAIAEFGSGMKNLDEAIYSLEKRARSLIGNDELINALLSSFRNISSWIEEKAAASEKSLFEMRFLMVSDDEFREGRMDAVFLKDNEVLVCDFKLEAESEHARVKYANQIEFYKNAASEIFDCPAQAVLKFLVEEGS
jgi:ATP-dependent helicase/nuclease subunit A